MRQRLLPLGISFERVQRSLRSLFSVFLLAIYVVGAIGVDLLHHSIHNHQGAEVHSSVVEKESCHRCILLGETENSCHHKAHFTSAEKCKFSHIVFQVQQELARYHTPLAVTESTRVVFGYQVSLATNSLNQPRLRGPPVV
jgi:hypothetical protein